MGTLISGQLAWEQEPMIMRTAAEGFPLQFHSVSPDTSGHTNGGGRRHELDIGNPDLINLRAKAEADNIGAGVFFSPEEPYKTQIFLATTIKGV